MSLKEDKAFVEHRNGTGVFLIKRKMCKAIVNNLKQTPCISRNVAIFFDTNVIFFLSRSIDHNIKPQEKFAFAMLWKTR